MLVLSHYAVAPLLLARHEDAAKAETSLDLNRTTSAVELTSEGVAFPGGQRLDWDVLEKIAENETACFVVEDNRAEKVQFFSEALNRFYSLMPTEGAPTMIAAGFPMHRIKGIEPHEDTLRKIRTLAPVTGPVLDTTTGLGYTAIEASRTASRVVTVELDPTVLEVCRRNPWSQELFDNPRIEQRIGDSFEVIQTFGDQAFHQIFHDPPTFKLAGQLYSGEFYRQLFRVLRRGGQLFHYIGDLESALGSNVSKGAIKRLQEQGFKKVIRRPEAFGLVAYK
jgi:predicted methyltransferase